MKVNKNENKNKNVFLPTWMDTTSHYYHVNVELICAALFKVHKYVRLSKINHMLIIKVYRLKSLSKILYNKCSLSLMFILCHIAALVMLSTSFLYMLLVRERLKLFTMYDDYTAGFSWTNCGSCPELVSLNRSRFLAWGRSN
jgi:hypothetical protein